MRITELRVFAAAIFTSAMVLFSCGSRFISSSSSATEDNSASGSVAAALGGALSGSSSSGTQASLFQPSFNLIPSAWASSTCPTFRTTGVGCTVTSGTMWLTYNSCAFSSTAPTWSGYQALIMSTGTAACGTFPNPGASASLVRQFVSSAGSTTPSSATVTSIYGTAVTLDHSTSNLGNFNSDTVSTANYANSGYGMKVTFNGSGARNSLYVAERVTGKVGSTTVFDHSVTTGGTPLTITETSGASTRTISGTMTVYHNLIKVIGTSTLTSVTHTDSCCYPTSGTISTTFAAGSVSPTTAGSRIVGKTETLTFTGCGTATLVDSSGNTYNVALTHCM